MRIIDHTSYDEDTLGKVRAALRAEGYPSDEADAIITILQNAHILFREPHNEPVVTSEEKIDELVEFTRQFTAMLEMASQNPMLSMMLPKM
jgi:hypothetical protein